jgi:hypothetical protein
MIRPFTGVRARRTIYAFWTVSAALLMSGLGAVPAAASGGTTTETGWLPLGCNIAGSVDTTNTNYSGGIGVHIATALKATHPTNLHPGETFTLTGVSAVQVVPPPAQTSGAVFGPVNGFEGIVSDFENVLTNATSNFNGTSTNGGLQVNQVRALQPTNDDTIPGGTHVTTTGDDKAFVSPDTSDPSPIDMWAEQTTPVPASDPQRHGVFSFGPIPINSSGSATMNAYGPAPGENGGPNVTDGIPRPIGTGLTVGGPVNHFTTTGVVGTNVVLDVGDSTRHVTNSIGKFTNEPLVALATIAFNDPTPPQKHQGVDPGTWGSTLPVACGTDNSNSPPSQLPLPPPAPGYCTNAPGTLPDVPTGCFVKAFTIPIVSGTVVPEAPIAVLLPLAGLLVVGTWLVYRRREAVGSQQS